MLPPASEPLNPWEIGGGWSNHVQERAPLLDSQPILLHPAPHPASLPPTVCGSGERGLAQGNHSGVRSRNPPPPSFIASSPTIPSYSRMGGQVVVGIGFSRVYGLTPSAIRSLVLV